MTRARGIALLLLTTLIWGTTFPTIKIATTALTSPQLVAVRFALALLVLGWFLGRATWRTWWHGALTGALASVSFLALAQGISTTGSARAGFLIGLNVILVPLAYPLLGRALSATALLGAVLASAGLTALAWDAHTLHLSRGDCWVLLSATSYAIYILTMDQFVKLHDSRAFSAAQVCCVLIIALLWVAHQGTPWPSWPGTSPPVPATLAQPTMLTAPGTLTAPGVQAANPAWPWVVLYLGLVATALTTWTQVMGQRVVPPVQAAIIYSLEPVFAAVFSALLVHEHLRARDLLGGALIVSGMLVCMLPQRSERGSVTVPT